MCILCLGRWYHTQFPSNVSISQTSPVIYHLLSATKHKPCHRPLEYRPNGPHLVCPNGPQHQYATKILTYAIDMSIAILFLSSKWSPKRHNFVAVVGSSQAPNATLWGGSEYTASNLRWRVEKLFSLAHLFVLHNLLCYNALVQWRFQSFQKMASHGLSMLEIFY